MAILDLEHLTFTYPEAAQPALQNVSLTVETGEFLVIGGPSGCGKSTLLRLLKPQLTPHGSASGRVLFDGQPLLNLDERTASSAIGLVQQSPDAQIVTDKVWHELAFGLESLGYDTPTIRRRVTEMASFFGIQNWFYQSTEDLSGGQKQLLNVASIMVMQPRVLLLDEPTSQLDPLAASEFLTMLKKINQEFGTTILLAEHRLEEALPLADRAAILEDGRLLVSGTVEEVGTELRDRKHRMFVAMPTAMRLWGSVETSQPCAVSVRDGQAFLAAYAAEHPLQPVPAKPRKDFGSANAEPCLSAKDLWFRYERDLPDVVRGVSLNLYPGEWYGLVGGNGTGKTTLLSLLCGLRKPYRGKVESVGRVALLPQNPQTLFLRKTVWEELRDGGDDAETEAMLVKAHLQQVVRRHPYDLSGGEQQRLALAKILMHHPDVLLLDEPTKGMDADAKKELASLLQEECSNRTAIVMVSHDIEFCAENVDRCALFFDGNIVTEEEPVAFFSGNHFYTTAANRIARAKLPTAVTADAVIEAMGGHPIGEDRPEDEPQDEPKDPPFSDPPSSSSGHRARMKAETRSIGRRIGALLSGLLSMLLGIDLIRTEHLSAMVSASGPTALGWAQLGRYCLLIGLLLLTAMLVGPRKESRIRRTHRPFNRRTGIEILVLFGMIPLTIWLGLYYLDTKQYYLTALAILAEGMAAFFLAFEGRRPQARELVLVAAVCALNIAGRAAFFMIPQFKPVLAMTILSGVALGGETGFLVGAVTMLASNMLFSQGPWTPWQMAAMGLCGFLAAVFYRIGLLRRSRASLCVFGALCAILVYGGIMNPTSVFLWGSEAISWNLILSYYITGFPMDCIHAAATAFFLFLLGEPMLNQFDRIKRKYGWMEAETK